MSQTIINGDSLEELKKITDNSIDAVITDPPYGIAFLGKDWDSFRGTKVARSQVVKNLGTGMRMTTHRENTNYQQWCEQWGRECLRVLKPGGWLLAFSAARLYHRITTGLEDAGFEIRDQIMWIYASGFPKAQDIGKAIQRRQGVEKTQQRQHNQPSYGGRGDHITQDRSQDVVPTSAEARQWAGWKTALKPAHEPIVMARKPFKGSTIDNVLEHGVGALNIDASRIPYADQSDIAEYLDNKRGPMERGTGVEGEQIGMFDTGTGFRQIKRAVSPEQDLPELGRFPSNVVGEIPDHQKYFYCPKVSRRERHRGFDIGDQRIDQSAGEMYGSEQGITRAKIPNVGNNHPTVKPVALMRYLIKLVTPQGAHIIDPFAGSGSTGMACKELGRQFTGIELDPHYCDIARRRMAATPTDPRETLFE